MKFRTIVSIVLVALAVLFYLYRPWPANVLLPLITAPVEFIVYIALLGSAALLIWSTLPKAKIDSAGKAVFITGCDSGFGNELARRLDKEGFHVFAGCLAPEREGARALDADTSDRLKLLRIDVTDDFQVGQAVSFVKDNIGNNELWAVVNNAGIAVVCAIEWLSIEEFMKVMDVNVFGVVRVTKAFLPLLRQSEGRVVNVASLAGRFTLPFYAAYSMSKKACIAFSDGLRQEMRKFNIKVVTIEPGLYKTPIMNSQYLHNQNRKSWEETPIEVRQDYGEEYFDDFQRQMELSLQIARTNINEVVDNMVEAVCAVSPNYRYVPYWVLRTRAMFISLLPTCITDQMFGARFPVLRQTSTRAKQNSPKKSN